jgi:hypothetical protein
MDLVVAVVAGDGNAGSWQGLTRGFFVLEELAGHNWGRSRCMAQCSTEQLYDFRDVLSDKI